MSHLLQDRPSLAHCGNTLIMHRVIEEHILYEQSDPQDTGVSIEFLCKHARWRRCGEQIAGHAAMSRVQDRGRIAHATGHGMFGKVAEQKRQTCWTDRDPTTRRLQSNQSAGACGNANRTGPVVRMRDRYQPGRDGRA